MARQNGHGTEYQTNHTGGAGTNTDAVPPRLYLNPNLLIIYTITLVAVLGVSSITPAFPAIVRTFNINPNQVGWLITAFTIPGVVLTPPLGVLADKYGRKTILVPALLLFAVAGTTCAFMRDFTGLLILRFFQGVGAASLGSLNVTLIGDLFSGRTRTAAMGYVSSVLSIGTASYPLIGGALASIAWYVPFYLPALAVIVALLVIFVLDNPKIRNQQSMGDYLRGAWKVISNGRVLLLFSLVMVTFIILFGSYLTFFPLFIDNRFSGSALEIGILMASMSLTTATVSANLGRITKRFRETTLLPAAFACYAIAMILIPLMPSQWLVLLPTILFGLGHGMIIPILLSMISGASPNEQRAAVMSVNGMVLRIGQTLGPLLIGLVHTFWNLPGVFFAGAILATLLGLGTLGLRGHPTPNGD